MLVQSDKHTLFLIISQGHRNCRSYEL